MAKTVKKHNIAINQRGFTVFNISEVSNLSGIVAKEGDDIKVILFLFYRKPT
jgi:hypothetical protein